jgi:hypothetical protein
LESDVLPFYLGHPTALFCRSTPKNDRWAISFIPSFMRELKSAAGALPLCYDPSNAQAFHCFQSCRVAGLLFRGLA